MPPVNWLSKTAPTGSGTGRRCSKEVAAVAVATIAYYMGGLMLPDPPAPDPVMIHARC
jgi:hypothetical protein